MKYIFLILIFFSTSVFGFDSQWEEVIIKKILTSVYPDKEVIIYSEDKDLLESLKNSKYIKITEYCEKADIVLSDLKNGNTCAKPEILFNYGKYRNTSNAIGIFFWQKGRPTIRFSSKRLEHFGLKVHGELSKFVTYKNN